MKKFWIKLGIVILAFALIATCFSLIGLASASGQIKTSAVSVKVSTNDQTVAVPVVIDSNPGFVSAIFKIGYNSTYFVLDSVTLGDDFASLTNASYAITETTPAANPYIISLEGDELTSNITATGTLVTLNFTVKANTPAGEYDVTINNDCDFVNFDLSAVSFDVTNNKVTLSASTHTPGDINGDDKVNSKDINRLINYIASIPGTEVNEDALDVNGDGKPGKSKDLNRLINYIASGKDATKYPIY